MTFPRYRVNRQRAYGPPMHADYDVAKGSLRTTRWAISQSISPTTTASCLSLRTASNSQRSTDFRALDIDVPGHPGIQLRRPRAARHSRVVRRRPGKHIGLHRQLHRGAARHAGHPRHPGQPTLATCRRSAQYSTSSTTAATITTTSIPTWPRRTATQSRITVFTPTGMSHPYTPILMPTQAISTHSIMLPTENYEIVPTSPRDVFWGERTAAR